MLHVKNIGTGQRLNEQLHAPDALAPVKEFPISSENDMGSRVGVDKTAWRKVPSLFGYRISDQASHFTI
jgi:hypothetical protein